MQTYTDPPPMRDNLSPEVVAAAKVISRALWGEPYKHGRGIMHYAGGPYWRNELLRQADEWERMAAAARTCASALPDR